MADSADEAFEIIERANAEALRVQREKQKVYEESLECPECGIELSEHRVRYGICVDCQTELERLNELKKRRGE